MAVAGAGAFGGCPAGTLFDRRGASLRDSRLNGSHAYGDHRLPPPHRPASVRRMRRTLPVLAALITLVLCAAPAHAQHFWWNAEGQTHATCAYGEITVLATHPHIYYCGVNWHPGEPAGGYCGIQDNETNERRTIFSIWDTSDELHPVSKAMDPRTDVGRFGGEGTGGHTHMVVPWKVGQTFQYFVRKTPAVGKADTTDASYYFVDPTTKKWVFEAVIQNPNGGHDEVGTIGGGMNSFLENFAGTDKDVARLATYKLWLGEDPEHLKPITKGGGDGPWGELHDAYFLATGSKANLDKVFASIKPKYGDPAWGGKSIELPPIKATPVPPEVVKQLQHLPPPPSLATTKP
jgi:hypothetical protein